MALIAIDRNAIGNDVDRILGVITTIKRVPDIESSPRPPATRNLRGGGDPGQIVASPGVKPQATRTVHNSKEQYYSKAAIFREVVICESGIGISSRPFGEL
jgi:hypothetical protein